MQRKEIQELLKNDGFLNYCLQANQEDVVFWTNWLMQRPEDADEIEELKRLVILMGKSSRNRVADENFKQLQQRISRSRPLSLGRASLLWRKWSIAAMLLSVLLASLFLVYNSRRQEPQLAQIEDVGPGGHRATLILADGKKIDLIKASNGTLVVSSGIKILKKEEGQIAYDMTSSNGRLSGRNTIVTPLGGQYQVKLSDGTRVWLNAGSSLTYPLIFEADERVVELIGEGYFEVSHNKSAPFRVKSGKQTVEVLGTHFDIMAYRDDRIMKTTLLEGAVRVINGGLTKTLSPGQQAAVFSEGSIQINQNADLEEVVAWKNGYFKFNENLEAIMSKIARWYGVQVVYQMHPDPSQTYSGKISRTKNLSAILKVIEFNGDAHFKISGKKVYVTR